MSTPNDNNQVLIAGTITEAFSYSHELHGEKFYITKLSVERLSNQKDLIPIMLSDRLIDVTGDYVGKYAEISGHFRSHNQHTDSQSKLLLFVFVKDFTLLNVNNSIDYKNQVFLNGYVSKPPIYRHTPLKKEITNLLLAVNRSYLKADYIPCILWGTNAKKAATLQTGTHIMVWGRIQSREYIKTAENGTETKTTYELSVSKLEPFKQ